MNEEKCENCGREGFQLQEHHISYLPVKKKKLCPRCHHNTHRFPYNRRFARIRYSRKGILTPASDPNPNYGYDEKRDRAYPKFRNLTEKEKMIRREMIKEEKTWKLKNAKSSLK